MKNELKQNQIEEMAELLNDCPYIAASIGCNKHEGSVKIAEFLCNAGCRRIPEGAVVLTRDELIPSIMADKIDEICKEITEGQNDESKDNKT